MRPLPTPPTGTAPHSNAGWAFRESRGRSDAEASAQPFDHSHMRDCVLLEPVALFTIAEPQIEALGPDSCVDHHKAEAAANCPSFSVGEQPRPDPLPPARLAQDRLAQTQALRVEVRTERRLEDQHAGLLSHVSRSPASPDARPWPRWL